MTGTNEDSIKDLRDEEMRLFGSFKQVVDSTGK
jgi:hypothetical protein